MSDKPVLRQEYEKYAKKYKLPDYDKLNTEFEFKSIELEKIDFLLRALRRRMVDKVVFFCRIIENILYPSQQNPLGMFESNHFEDDKKEKLSKVLKKLLIIERKSLLLDVNPDEKKDAEFIMNLNNEWPKMKEPVQALVDELILLWDKEEKKSKENYFS